MVKKLLLSLLFVFYSLGQVQGQSAFDSAKLSPKMRQAYLRLLKSEKFSLGHTGYAGERTDEDESLRILLKGRKAAKALEHLIESGSPEGKLYGLFGLRLKEKSAYRKALQSLNLNYEPSERTSFWGIRIIDETGTIDAENLDKGLVPKGSVVTDIRGIVQIKKWNEIITAIENGDYDDLFKRR